MDSVVAVCHQDSTLPEKGDSLSLEPGMGGCTAETQSAQGGQATIRALLTCLKGGLQPFLKASLGFSFTSLITISCCRSERFGCYCSTTQQKLTITSSCRTQCQSQSREYALACNIRPFTASPTPYSVVALLSCSAPPTLVLWAFLKHISASGPRPHSSPGLDGTSSVRPPPTALSKTVAPLHPIPLWCLVLFVSLLIK